MSLRALISVSDKTGLIPFVQGLCRHGVEILSTGGTAQALRAAGIAVQDVSDYTGSPEILDGRVKTLHPKIHAGLLARRESPQHMATLKTQAIPTIDFLIVNFYPFEKTVADKACHLDEAVEQIDIGGPAMVRSAAKNYAGVSVILDPTDYDVVLAELKASGHVSRAQNFRLAQKAFALVAAYDAAIINYLSCFETESTRQELPQTLARVWTQKQALRYGENPHQWAAWYVNSSDGLAAATQLQGKELSYNNILDADAALELARALSDQTAAVIVKHTNPCGVGVGATLQTAYDRALATDPVSCFGGIVALTRPLDAATATKLAETFYEVILAPEITPEAQAVLLAKKNLRVLRVPSLTQLPLAAPVLRSVQGGILYQDNDVNFQNVAECRVVTARAPSAEEQQALSVAWRICHYVKSNAIVFANATGTVAVGAGQTSRVDAVNLAVSKSHLPLAGSVVASDAFFPFADGLEAAAAAGATAVIHPGGSVRDDEVIAAANRHNMAMILTGARHFRH